MKGTQKEKILGRKAVKISPGNRVLRKATGSGMKGPVLVLNSVTLFEFQLIKPNAKKAMF